MKKPISFLCVILTLFMTVNFSGAKEMTSSIPASGIAGTFDVQDGQKVCDQVNFTKVAYENGSPGLPYLIQANQKACLDKCSQAYDSCMSGTGDSGDAKFRCEDKRRTCTLGCNNEWYPKHNL
jgi:hypothetical protein